VKIRQLYLRRNNLIHAALGVAGHDFITGVPAGSVINLRTCGFGFTEQKGDTWTIGYVGKRIHLEDIDLLTADIHNARLSLVPYMELVDKIKHPPRALPMPEVGKRL
jgi:hypothetical protein